MQKTKLKELEIELNENTRSKARNDSFKNNGKT